MRSLRRWGGASPAPLGAALFLLVLAHVAGSTPAAADEWLRYETDHFQVIYRAADAEAAARVVEVAPSVWERTTRFLRYRPSERIPVVLYGETARANGFFTPYPPHVALFTAAPAGPWMGARTEDWLESVFIHEVTHYLHLMQPIGFFGTASRLFGPLAAAGGTLFLPGWAVEGPTTTAETTLTAGGRGRNPYFEMEWVAPILEDEMYSYDQAGVGSAYAPRGRIYSAGYLLTDHLLREYGEDTFIELNRTFQRWPFLGMRRALRRTIGLSGPEVHQEMVDSLTVRYAARRNLPAGAAIANPDDHSRRSADPLTERHLVGVTDRGAVVFHRSAFDPGSIQLLDEDRSWRHLAAVRPLDEYSVAVSADGKVAAAVVQRANRAGTDGGQYVSSGDLYLLDVDDGGYRRLTTDARLFHAALDGTGTTVVAVERTGPFSRLVTVDSRTGDISPVYAPRERFLSMPALSRDGRYLAVVENNSGRQSVVVLKRTGATSPRYAPAFRVDVGGERDAEYRPRFAGNRELWFAGDADGIMQLYRTTLPGDDTDPAPTMPPIERILTDRVGVISGLPLDSEGILYGTYRSGGYTVRRGLPTPERVGHLTTESATEASVTVDSIPASTILAESRPYWDLPRPVLWFPTAEIAGEVSGTTRFDVGAGVISVGTLGRHNLQAFAAYNPTDRKPSGSVAYTYSPGPTALTVTAAADYTVESGGSLRDLREISATLARPIWYDEGPSRYRGVGAQVGATYETRGSPGSSRHASVSGAARAMRYRYGGSGQIYGGTGGELRGALRYRPAILDQMEPELSTVTSASLRLGSGGRLQLQPLVAFATSDSGSAVDILPWNASRFSPEGRGAITAADTAIIARGALAAVARPLDLAWRGVSLQNLGSKVYASQAVTPDGYAADNYTVAGAELALHGKFNLIPLELTAGIAMRIPHGEDAGERRTQFYVNLGGAAVDQLASGGVPTP